MPAGVSNSSLDQQPFGAHALLWAARVQVGGESVEREGPLQWLRARAGPFSEHRCCAE